MSLVEGDGDTGSGLRVSAVRQDGAPSFPEMQAATDEGRTAQLVDFDFDLLFVDGKDLTRRALCCA